MIMKKSAKKQNSNQNKISEENYQRWLQLNAEHDKISGGPIDGTESNFSYYMWFKGVGMIALYVLNLVYREEIHTFLSGIVGKDLSTIIVVFVIAIGGIYFLLFRGFLNVGSAQFGQMDPMWNANPITFRSVFSALAYSPSRVSSSSSSEYKNIDRVNDFVNSKARFQTREDASKTILTMNSVNSINETHQGKRVLEYIDSKMRWMTRDNGFNFISKKLSK